MLKIFLYTIKTAFFSTMIAAFIGIGIAFFTAKRNFLGRKFLLSLGIVPLCIPPLVIALGYVGFFGVNGFFSKVISLIFGIEKEKINFLYTTLGVVIAQGFYNFPFVTKIVSDAWERLPNETENAARLLGADEKRIFFTITLPRLSGAIAAACIPVFLFCFFSFMIVLLFSPAGNSTLEVELYHCIRTTLDFSKGVNIVILESLTSLLVVFIYSYIIRKNQYRVDGVSFQEITRYKIGRKPFENKNQIFLEKALFIFLIMLILLFFISPGI